MTEAQRLKRLLRVWDCLILISSASLATLIYLNINEFYKLLDVFIK